MITFQQILPKILQLNADRNVISVMYKKYRKSQPLGLLGVFDDSVDTTDYVIEKPNIPISDIIKKHTDSDWSVGLSSRIILSNGIYHIPMMDFQISISAESEQLLYDRISEVLALDNYPGGWLLQTTNSYHFIGSKIVDSQTWLRFIGRMLLLRVNGEIASIADDKYIGYCLCRLDTPLRCSLKGGVVPFVVREINMR